MSSTVKSLAARFGEHQRKFLAAGGKPKAIKYPAPWRAEARRLRSELGLPIATLARELGVGHSALKRWCGQGEGAKPRQQRKGAAKARFVPVEVIAGDGQRRSPPAVRTAAARVTLREVTVDIAPDADDDGAVAAVIATLVRSGGYASC